MRPWSFISVLVLSTLNNTVMGSFRNNPIKENVVFLMGKIEIIRYCMKENDTFAESRQYDGFFVLLRIFHTKHTR